MKKAIITLEAVILCILIVITSVIIIPKVNPSDKEEPSETTPTSPGPVVINQEYDPFAEYRIDGYSSEQMFTYFTELVNNAEYSDNSSIHQLVQKWVSPIYYKIYGDPTEEDMRVINDFFDKLNSLYYFPGIYEVKEGEDENLSIYFIDKNLFDITFGDVINNEEADGAAEYWFYTDSCEIYEGRIGYVTETDQEIRNSVIIEEIVNVLGLSDTYLRDDSIVYQYSSTNTEPSEIDWLIIKALYHPLITPAMTPEECRETPIFSY